MNTYLGHFWQDIYNILRSIKIRLLGQPYQQFTINLYEVKDWKSLSLATDRPVAKIRRRMVTDMDALFVADPFLFFHKGKYYLFFEAMCMNTKLGRICYCESNDGRKWRYGGIILAGDQHFSFPNVFTHENEIYMLPESPQSSCVLYKAVDFPKHWTVATTLVDRVLADASLLQFEGKWFLWGSPVNSELRVYFADNFLGPYQEHPCSPVVTENKAIGRPAGKVIQDNGIVYRFFQDCTGIYGKSVGYAKIDILNPIWYNEIPAESLFLSRPEGQGTHHIDILKQRNCLYLCAVDVWFRSYSGKR